jgi:heavy metal efflux system protein
VSLVERLVRWALAQRAFVLLSVVALVVTGIVAYRDLDVEAFPDLTNNQVVVITAAPGLAAPEVEQRVTYPLETSLLGLPRTEEVRSISKFALSIVTIVFEDGVPVYLARQLVTERVNEARDRLPAGLTPALGPVATAFGEIYQYLVEAPPELALETRAFHDWEMRTRLRAVPGVSDVNSWGGWSRTYEVVVDPFRLEQHGLTLADVTAALDANNRSFSGGFLESRSERLAVRGVGLLRDERDILQTVIRASAGTPLRVSDVADVRTGHLPREGAVTRDGRGEVLSGMVIMLQGENGRDVASAVKQQIDEIRKTLPARTTIVPFYDQSEVIERTARTVRRNLTEGVVLVIIVLVLFLRNLRVALIVTLVMPLALLSGFIGMRLTGVSANLMSLGAIDFGLMVDGAIVMIESIVRRRQKLRSEGTVPAARLREVDASAAAEVARPVLFGIVIILAVYLPLFALEGLEGKMFRPMAITMCAALFGALLLTLTAVPVAANLTLGPTAIQPEQAWFERLRAAYLRVLAGALRRVSLTLALAGSAIIVAIGSVPWLGTEFMPRLDEGAILIETRQAAVGVARGVGGGGDARRTAHPRVPGGAAGGDQDGSPGSGDRGDGPLPGGRVREPPPYAGVDDRPIARPADRRDGRGAVGVARHDLELHAADGHAARRGGLGRAGRSGPQDLRPGHRHARAAQPGGARAARRHRGPGGPADRGALRRHPARGADRSGRRRPLRPPGRPAPGGGRSCHRGHDGHRAARRCPPLSGTRPPAGRLSRLPEALTTLPLVAPGGERLRLGQVATVRQVAAQEVIHHEHGERRVVVQGNARGRDIGGVVADAQARLATLALPPGYYLAWSGQFEHQARATARLALIIPCRSSSSSSCCLPPSASSASR